MLESMFQPLIFALKYLYLGLFSLTNSHGLSLILLSCVTSTIVIFLGRLLQTYTDREQQIQDILAPQLRAIRTESTGSIRISEPRLFTNVMPIIPFWHSARLFRSFCSFPSCLQPIT